MHRRLARVTLADEYRRQRAWRAFSDMLAELPPLAGCTVLDLGCAVGDVAAELAARGARVIGVDANEELLRAARARELPRADFRSGDLRTADLDVAADGIWSSFVAAYFPADLADVLARWRRRLRPGGWIALVEVDDLFAHAPLAQETRALLAAYARDALFRRRYDFHMGGKLRAHLERAGFIVRVERAFPDRELAGTGPAPVEVVDAWRRRFARMQSLADFCGASFAAVRDDFLAALAHADHRSACRVCFCLATPAER